MRAESQAPGRHGDRTPGFTRACVPWVTVDDLTGAVRVVGGADASVRVENETSIASSAPRVTGDARVGVRGLLTVRPTKRAIPKMKRKKKKAKGAIQVSPRVDGWNAAHPNADDYKILQTAVRNRGAFCPWMTRECVQPEAARTTASWVKGNAYSCCQGDDHSCCSQRMPQLISEPSVSRTEWCVRLDVVRPLLLTVLANDTCTQLQRL